MEAKVSIDTLGVLKTTIKDLSLEQVKELQNQIGGLLKAVVVVDKIKRRRTIGEVRLDDATPEELLEEKAHLDLNWDPIFNIDKDRMIEGSIEIEFISKKAKLADNMSVNRPIPILDYRLRGARNPQDNIAVEFFRQFLNCEDADDRFIGVSPEMLLAGYHDFVQLNGPIWLWGYISEINECGTSLTNTVTGEIIEIDVSASTKESFEDWQKQKEGKPKIIKTKPFNEEDVYERVQRKYRVAT